MPDIAMFEVPGERLTQMTDEITRLRAEVASLQATVTVAEGDVIRIVPEKGPERVMTVAHVEHYVITLADLPAEAERGS